MTELLPLMTYCFVMSSTPGPNNVMLTTSGANFGFRAALPQIMGINIGVALQTLVMCLGLGQVFLAFPMVQPTLRVAAAIYLIYLAYKLSGATVKEGAVRQPPTLLQGLMFQAVNPKSWIKAVTLASVFMPTGMDVVSGALLVTVVGSVIGLPCSTMWAGLGVGIRRLLSDPRKQRAFNLTMGAILVVLALMFLK